MEKTGETEREQRLTTHIWSRHQWARREELAFDTGLSGKRKFPEAQGGLRPISRSGVSSDGTQQPSGEE